MQVFLSGHFDSLWKHLPTDYMKSGEITWVVGVKPDGADTTLLKGQEKHLGH